MGNTKQIGLAMFMYVEDNKAYPTFYSFIAANPH